MAVLKSPKNVKKKKKWINTFSNNKKLKTIKLTTSLFTLKKSPLTINNKYSKADIYNQLHYVYYTS